MPYVARNRRLQTVRKAPRQEEGMIQHLPNQQQCLQGKSNSVWEEVIATIPQERRETVLEVALMHHGAGRTDVELRSMVWGNGLGWYRQSTFILDQATARRLLATLSSVRRRLEPAGAAGSEHGDGTKVILFPDSRKGLADAERATALMAQ
jgi:hypothetical protein